MGAASPPSHIGADFANDALLRSRQLEGEALVVESIEKVAYTGKYEPFCSGIASTGVLLDF